MAGDNLKFQNGQGCAPRSLQKRRIRTKNRVLSFGDYFYFYDELTIIRVSSFI